MPSILDYVMLVVSVASALALFSFLYDSLKRARSDEHDWSELNPKRAMAAFIAIGLVLTAALVAGVPATCRKYSEHPIKSARTALVPGAASGGVFFTPLDSAVARGNWWAQYVCKPYVLNPPWLLLTSLAAAPSVLLTWYWRTRQKLRDQQHTAKQIVIASDGALTERYTHALEALMHHRSTPRLGAIYQMEHVALESPAYRERVVQALCGYLRSETPVTERLKREADEREQRGESRQSPVDGDTPRCGKHEVEAVLGVLSRLNPMMQAARAPEPYRYPLAGVHFVNLRLIHLDLSHADFSVSEWTNSDIIACDLRHARFWKSTVTKVEFTSDTDLTDVSFVGVFFDAVKFSWANMTRVDLQSAALENGTTFEAITLNGTVINGVDLRSVAIHEQADFKGARDDRSTQYPTGFDRDAHGVEHIRDRKGNA